MAKKESNKGSGNWNPERATQAAVTYNPAQNGIEVRFNGELSEEMKSKLRVFGFRPSKLTGLWYATKSEESTAFAKEVTEVLPTDPEGPPLHLSPSFDPIKPNVEKKEYSFISISLKDGQNKSYILFEPSKPKADLIALEFAKKEFGNQFSALVVKPRMSLREARLLFEEGKIILPSSAHPPKEASLKEPGRNAKIDPPTNEDEEIIIDENERSQTTAGTKSEKQSDPLASAYWKENDHQPGAIIGGVLYDQARLREVLLGQLSKLPLETQLETVEKLKTRFQERRPLEEYLRSNLAASGKTEAIKKTTAIKLYVDDIVIDNDLWTDSGYKVLKYLINLLIQRAGQVNDPAEYKEPWMMEQKEFLDYVQDYVKRFRVYPVDVLEMFDILVRKFPGNEKLLSEKNPSQETLEKVVKLVHLLHIYKAIAKGRDVSPSILAKDYPWFRSKALSTLAQTPDRREYGFDATDFKTPENFLTLLQSVGVSSAHKKCSYINYPFTSPPVYLWQGENIRFVTANNPLDAEGYASSMGIEGNKTQVLKAVEYIEAHTESKGEEGLEYINFEKLFCIDPEDPFFGQPGGPSGSDKTNESSSVRSREDDAKNSTKEITRATNEIVYQKPKHKFSTVTEVDRSLITTRPEIFQGRETGYAPETVDKIVREGFDKSQEPIVVWKDEDGKLVVISGHSRWEASRRLHEAGDGSLGTMPVKIYQGTLADAIDFALLESNRGVTQEGLKSDLRAYKYAKHKGYNREYLQGIFKPESRLKLLEDISHLNEGGCFLSHIDTEAEKSFPYLQRNAHWVGQIRKQFPALTNSHEEEMFGYLYGLNNESKKAAGKKLIITKGQFFDLIEKKVGRIDFQSNKPLNLDQIVSANVLTDPAKERIQEIERDIDKLEKERLQKDELIARAFKEQKDTLVEKFRNRQTEINQIITRKILEKEKIEREIGILEKTSIDLFSSSLDTETESGIPKGLKSTFEHPDPVEHNETNDRLEHNPAPSSEVVPATHVMPQSVSEQQSTKATEDNIDRIVAIMHGKYANSERATKKEIESLGNQLGISNTGKVWEAVELSWLLWYQMIYKQPFPFETRLSQMVKFWDKVQPTYAYSDSSKEIYKQYSTPCPIGAIIAQYTGMDKSKAVFDPSSGNGLLVLGANASSTSVNEIDSTRIDSLKFQGFKSITTFNATQPFPEEYTRSFDIVVTNPPFTKWDEDQFDKDILVQKIFDHHVGLNFHLRLEHVMAGIALHCMKDSGKAAIILMNHIYFDSNGFIGKYRPFFNWLYRHYVVDDVINMNSYKLYNKQGAIQKTMLVLIDGRKPVANGVAPRREDAPQLEEMVESFEELWKRVNKHMYLKIFSGAEVLNRMSDESKHSQSLRLDMERDNVKAKKFYKIPLSISELRRNDIYLDTIINERLHNFKQGRKITDPIIIGETKTPKPHSGVLDGFLRVVQAVANGESLIEAYVPIDNQVYITRYHSGYTIEKIIQQLTLAITA